jgi:hypothetical protein
MPSSSRIPWPWATMTLGDPEVPPDCSRTDIAYLDRRLLAGTDYFRFGSANGRCRCIGAKLSL